MLRDMLAAAAIPENTTQQNCHRLLCARGDVEGYASGGGQPCNTTQQNCHRLLCVMNWVADPYWNPVSTKKSQDPDSAARNAAFCKTNKTLTVHCINLKKLVKW